MTQGMLITVKHSEVPKYLHSSELYGTFSDEADDEISVPKDCIKPNPSVRTVDELQHLLATLRFWILRAFPRDLIHFLVSRTNSDVVLDVLSNFRDAFPDVWQLLSSLKMSQCKQACRQSAEFGRIDFLQYFIQLKKPLSMSVLVAAADNGHVDCLRHVHSALVAEKHLNWKDIDISSVIRRGQSTCLFYMIEQGVHISERGCILAAQTSHFTCLELLLSASSVRTEAVCTSAVKNGGARTLQCAVEKGCTVGERTWTAAIALSDTSCFQYLLDSFPNTVSSAEPPCPQAASRARLPPAPWSCHRVSQEGKLGMPRVPARAQLRLLGALHRSGGRGGGAARPRARVA